MTVPANYGTEYRPIFPRELKVQFVRYIIEMCL